MIPISRFSLAGFALALVALTVPISRAASMQDYLASAPFKMPAVAVPVFPEHNFSITDFGAVGDGHTLNTAAFSRAIEACAQAGGGHVVVPAGLWLTGPIVLKSNVDLHTDRGALVQLTPDHTAYPMVPRGDRGFVAASGISANGQTNIALTGEGVFDGAGETWRPVKKSKMTETEWQRLLAQGGVTSNEGTNWWPTKEAMMGEDYLAALAQKTRQPTAEESLPTRDFRRSPLVSLTGCDNVLIEGVTLRNSPSGVFSPSRCTNVTVRYATIFNEWSAQNGDGMDIGPCKNVVIYRCTVSAGDDAICMKAGGKSPWPGEPGLQNVIVAECTVYRGHGGFVVGGTTEAGMQNLWATQCDFVGTDTGIRVKSGLGHGGLVRDVFVDHIYMKDILNEAILFDTFYDNTPVSATTVKVALSRDAAKTPEFRDFVLRDIYCAGAGSAIALTGLPQQPVHKIVIERAIITAQRGFRATDAADITLKQVKINTPETPAVVQKNTRNIRFVD
jgi:polygalacturonase